MSLFITSLPSLTIANGATDSNELLASGGMRDAWGLTVYAPATLPETVTVMVCDVESGTQVWRTLQNNGTDVTLAAGKATQLDNVSFAAVRLHSAAGVAADRVFTVTKQMPV